MDGSVRDLNDIVVDIWKICSSREIDFKVRYDSQDNRFYALANSPSGLGGMITTAPTFYGACFYLLERLQKLPEPQKSMYDLDEMNK